MPDPWKKRVGFLIGGLFLFRLVYVASGLLDLYADEAYYWVWSKHPDWSYFSKGPLVAYLILVSTRLGGDTDFFVRLPAVLLGTISLIYVGRLAGALFGTWRAAFWSVVLLACLPILQAISIILTIDNPLVCMWSIAAFHLWQASRPQSNLLDWLIVGLALGVGLMAKAAMAFFIPSLLLFLVLHAGGRGHLKSWRPWAALALGLAFLIPQILWNAKHEWVMFRDFAEKGEVGESFYLGLGHTVGLFFSQAFSYSPLIFLGVLAACGASVRRARQGDDVALFILCLSFPVFLFYGLLSLHAHINSNWMLVGYLTPLIALAGYAGERWDARSSVSVRRSSATLATVALLLGGAPAYAWLFTEPLYHLTDWQRLRDLDPSNRVAGWRELAGRVDHWRRELDRGRPIFMFDKEYQVPSILNFYGEGEPVAVSLQTSTHRNQYYFITDLESLKGSDAIAVLESRKDTYIRRMEKSFRRVRFLEAYPIMRGDIELRTVYLYHCKNFRNWKY